MPMWRCPHCGTPQAETARCWVCHRSSTACGTCRHFRRSVAAQLGYCGLDRSRRPLSGSEIRGCWEGWPVGDVRPDLPLTIGPADRPDEHPHRDFIEVVAIADPEREELGPEAPTETAATMAPRKPAAAAVPARDYGWSLWGDPEG
jgi:hypothetical protein